MAARKPSWVNLFLALLFSLLSLIFVFIIILSGLGGHVPAEYLKIDTTNLAIPAKLGTSTFLQDLSAVASTDYVGQPATSQTLGLAKTYSLTLLTACAQADADSSSATTTCSKPRIGYNFNPGSDLKLDSTAAASSTLPSTYRAQLQTHRLVSTFLGIAYAISIPLTLLSCLCILLTRCFPRVVAVGRVASGLVSAVLLAAAIASVVAFVRLRDTFNGALGDIGVETAAGSRAFGLGFGAAGLSFAAFLGLLVQARSRGSRRSAAFAGDGKGGTAGFITGEQHPQHQQRAMPVAAAAAAGFLKRMGRPKYTQVEKRTATHGRAASPDEDREGLIGAGEDDFAHAHVNDFAMRDMEQKRSRGVNDPYDLVNTAYEPAVF
ncbi:Uu.00g054550.m01.CDS01 [Anthostomella pinea]|uniref:Uu.00g054550.m01.CDS01 n=1 Tax=Anthostomella pinea TaxID=933095 RepID=A0AAI8YPP1_9PEZI|nr:Uu.00g054550.m01.CDS01 [Anthostomella pinea]